MKKAFGKKKLKTPKTIEELRKSDNQLYEYFLYLKYKVGITFKQFVKEIYKS